MSKILQATFGTPDKPLKVGEYEIQCYVLENKQRVLVQSGLLSALGMSTGGSQKTGTRKIDEFIQNSYINPFISKELSSRVSNAIEFKTPKGKTATAYEATILVDICDAILEANKRGKLHPKQAHILERAESLIRSFAKVGIIALVDEATGYQEIREKDALKQFLEKFLQEEQAKWIKTFDDEFFEMIFKMKKWTWSYASTKKPQVVGHYINNLVYARLGPKVLDTITERNIDKETGKRIGKKFQFLSTDYGHPKLKEHLAALIALGKASGYNWTNFNRMVERAFPKFGDTLEIGFADQDEN